jgi:hypothetical protein
MTLVLATPFASASRAAPIVLEPGPQLFLDDFLVAESHRVTRVVNRPTRDPAIPNPIVTGREDGCFQPYLTVLRDRDAHRFRMWYGAATSDRHPSRSRLAYIESDDGVHWERPRRLLETPAIQFGASVLDDSDSDADAERRFKFAWWAPSRVPDAPGGLKIATSPDGFAWTQLKRPGEADDVLLAHNHDINSIFRDPIRRRYVAIASTVQTDPAWRGERRVTVQSTSDDLLTWSPPRRILVPDPKSEHEQTQFYAMDGFLVRGALVIGMVKVLRDDLHADEPPDPPDAFGVGYTALAWTRDGEHWTRDRETFFERDPRKGAWDHAHAWIDEQLPFGDEVFLYYGGYARGHKVERFEERQIGLVRMGRDRYAAREAGAEGGRLITPVVTLPGQTMTINATTRDGGAIVVRVLDADAGVVNKSEPITGDGVDLPVRWLTHAPVAGRPAQLEFAMTRARLFAFLTTDP